MAREQSGRFDTLTMLTNRGEYTKAVQDALAAKWKKIGLTVEQVSVQDVRYGEAITKKYTEAQAAEIDKQKALNEQQVAKTEAETKKIKAQGEADANAVLNESLTDNVLKQHYIDALSNADQLVVVPDGADTLVMFKRYPYTIALLTVISFVVCIVWLFTHEACMHPLGNGLAAWWAFIVVPILLVTIVEEAGGEE